MADHFTVSRFADFLQRWRRFPCGTACTISSESRWQIINDCLDFLLRIAYFLFRRDSVLMKEENQNLSNLAYLATLGISIRTVFQT